MKSIRLRENLGIRIGDSSCEIHGPRGLKLIDLTALQVEMLRRLWVAGLPAGKVTELPAAEKSLLQTLSDKKLLRLHESDYSRDEIWLSHFAPDARQALAELAGKTVMIAGCGGTGAIIADHLARAGVKKFILIDAAELDAPDLNRQWPFTKDEIGKAKVEILAQHLDASFGVESKTYMRLLNSSADLVGLRDEKCDLIVWCADKPRWIIEMLALELAGVRNTPLLFGAVGITDDQAGPVLVNAADRERERGRIQAEEGLGLDAHTIRGSLCFTNTMAAAKAGFLAYRFLLNLA